MRKRSTISSLSSTCEHKPAELPGLLGSETEDHDMEWFFFTRNAYKYNKSCRSNRSTKGGFWKITGKEHGVRARRSKAVIGKKRTLTFYHGLGKAKKKKTGWVNHEYYLPRNEVISCLKQEKQRQQNHCKTEFEDLGTSWLLKQRKVS